MTDLTNRTSPEVMSLPRKIIGSTTINHEVRTRLCISNNEYVMMDFFDKFHKASKPIQFVQIYEHIGIEKEEASEMISRLFHKGFIERYDKGVSVLKPSEKWYQGFNEVDNEFESFWKPMDFVVAGTKKHITWTGAKPDALTKYRKLRKEENYEYLLKQKSDYFRMIAHSDFRQVMGCSVFLNITTKKYSEDWTKYLKKDELPTSTKKPTKAEMKGAF